MGFGNITKYIISFEYIIITFGMSSTVEGVDCGVVEWVKRGTLRWYGHVMRMNEDCFAKRVYESSIEGGGVRGRPPVNSGSIVWMNIGEKEVADWGLRVLEGNA